MKFGPASLAEAEGRILGHNVTGSNGRRLLRKGSVLTAKDITLLEDMGRSTVYVASLEEGDVSENAAALRVARAVAGEGLRLTGPSAGRANILALEKGVVRVDSRRLARINGCSGITLATLLSETAVQDGKMVATVKILPFAVPEEGVLAVEGIAAETGPVISLDVLAKRRVTLILSASPQARERTINRFAPHLRALLAALNATISAVEFVPLEDEKGELELAQRLQEHVASKADLIVLAGETAIMDAQDIAPRAVKRAGGEISSYGAPVDPGNLLLLAYVDGVPVLGAPGCVSSFKRNIVDKILPRLLVGDHVSGEEISAWGHGGLLEDIRDRPYPRDKIED